MTAEPFQIFASTWERYQEGLIDAPAALGLLMADYGDTDLLVQQAQAKKDALRLHIAEVLSDLGNKPAYAGGYAVRFRDPSRLVSFDAKALDTLIERYATSGDPARVALAVDLAAARRETTRSGGLQIQREPERPVLTPAE